MAIKVQVLFVGGKTKGNGSYRRKEYLFISSCVWSLYDKDTFTEDDKMGDAEIDMKPYVECRKKMFFHNIPNGTKVDRVLPNTENCPADESYILWNNGKMFQDMCLRLGNVARGEVDVQIEWIDPPSCGCSFQS
ncbi:protein C2-DOMAIN ABA-RELATED 7-like [Actinidia eriantha]|uniref:protein C2-DOMAIN ABA-RELATED 7-like n=1 Tax=Actinidia eriantha TaxID=165200 RepID=UPI0025909BB6|nr:protein C2-DOMAIN ABA-RELATED 7-like [Actinidia eriantha]